MKNQSGAVFLFSDYPLANAPRDKKQRVMQRLMLIPSGLNRPTTFIQKNKLANDPRNWDQNWFGNYE